MKLCKHPALSKTLWLNGLIAAGLFAEANIGLLKGTLPEDKYVWVAFGLPIVNILLRTLTTTGISAKSQMPQDTNAGK